MNFKNKIFNKFTFYVKFSLLNYQIYLIKFLNIYDFQFYLLIEIKIKLIFKMIILKILFLLNFIILNLKKI